MVQRGSSFLSNTASTAIGVAIGSSILGMPMASLDTYLQLSKVLTQVKARFRDAEEGATSFGRSMGYSMGESAQFAETLGKVSNNLEGGKRYLGFARAMGADPNAALTSLGRLGDLSGGSLSNADLNRLRGSAGAVGMDMGRMDEFLTRLESATMAQFRQTGAMDPSTAATMMTMPAAFFGQHTPGATENTSLMGGLNEMLSGKTGDTFQTYMMRAIGYGSDPTMSYRKARMQVSRGAYDEDNYNALIQQPDFAEIIGSDATQESKADAIFKALSTYKGSMTEGDLSVLSEVMASGASPYEASKRMMAVNKADQDYNVITNVSTGESFNNQKESRMYKLGAELAPSLDELVGTVDSLVGMARNFLGGDFFKNIESAMKGVEKFAERIEQATREPGEKFQKMAGETFQGAQVVSNYIDEAGWTAGGTLVAKAFFQEWMNLLSGATTFNAVSGLLGSDARAPTLDLDLSAVERPATPMEAAAATAPGRAMAGAGR